jgi:hypothetical protein
LGIRLSLFHTASVLPNDLCMRIRIVESQRLSNTFSRCLLRDTRWRLPAVHHHLSGFRSPQSAPLKAQSLLPPQNTKRFFTTFHRPYLSPLHHQRARSFLRRRQVISAGRCTGIRQVEERAPSLLKEHVRLRLIGFKST